MEHFQILAHLEWNDPEVMQKLSLLYIVKLLYD